MGKATELPASLDRIRQNSESRERFLTDLLRGRFALKRSYVPSELRFVVARRWNSWYPSFFDVEGGCYVLIPGDLDPRSTENATDNRVGAVVIDPGFRFLDVLRKECNLEPGDISAVIVTHFHPDHMAGLIEYVTIMNASKLQCSLYMNETSYAAFRSLQNAFINVNELRAGQIQELMRYRTIDGLSSRITVKAVGVHHNELGNLHRALGLILETRLGRGSAPDVDVESRHSIGIVGDTDGNEQYLQGYVEDFHGVDVLVLHLGSFSNRKLGRGGKHLYIEGTRRLLECMGAHIERAGGGSWKGDGQRKKLVLLSEFGLELADDAVLFRCLQPFVASFSWRVPLAFAAVCNPTEDVEMGEPAQDQRSASRIFARATLGLLEQACALLQPRVTRNWNWLSRSDVDDLILALGYQPLVVDGAGVRETIQELDRGLSEANETVRDRRLMDGLPVEKYVQVLQPQLKERDELRRLRAFYKALVREAHAVDGQLRREDLAAACTSLMREVVIAIESPVSLLRYSQRLDQVSQYASMAVALKQSGDSVEGAIGWVLGKGQGVSTLGPLLCASLVALILLRDALLSTSLPSSSPRGSAVVQIADFFGRSIARWGNLLAADIGCTIGIDPFGPPPGRERNVGLMLMSENGRWLSLTDATAYHDATQDRVRYRARATGQVSPSAAGHEGETGSAEE